MRGGGGGGGGGGGVRRLRGGARAGRVTGFQFTPGRAGAALLEMATVEEAVAALCMMDGERSSGRVIRVAFSRASLAGGTGD